MADHPGPNLRFPLRDSLQLGLEIMHRFIMTLRTTAGEPTDALTRPLVQTTTIGES